MDQKEQLVLLVQRVIEVPLELLGHQVLLVNFLFFLLTSCSKEMLLQDPRERPEEMPSMKEPDLKRTVMLTSSQSTQTSTI